MPFIEPTITYKTCKDYPVGTHIYRFQFVNNEDIVWGLGAVDYRFILDPTTSTESGCRDSSFYATIEPGLSIKQYSNFEDFCTGWAATSDLFWVNNYGGHCTHLGNGVMEIETNISAWNIRLPDVCTVGIKAQCVIVVEEQEGLSDIRPNFTDIISFCCTELSKPPDPCPPEPKPDEPIQIAESCTICNDVVVKWYYKEPTDTDFVYKYEEKYKENEPIANSLEFTERGVYQIKAEVCNCCGCCCYIETIRVGNPLLLYRKGPNKYILNDIREYTQTYKMELALYGSDSKPIMVKSGNETIPVKLIIEPYKGQDIEIDIPQDGIYYLYSSLYRLEDNGTYTLVESNRWCLFEIGTIMNCFMSYVIDVLCFLPEQCDKRKVNEDLYELNRFVTLSFGVISSMLFKWNHSDGIFEYKAEDIAMYEQSEKYIAQLLKMCKRCTNQHVVTNYQPPCIKCSQK